MTTINIDVPDNVNQEEIKEGLQMAVENIDSFEDFLLGLKMREVDNNEETYPIDNLRKKYES